MSRDTRCGCLLVTRYLHKGSKDLGHSFCWHGVPPGSKMLQLIRKSLLVEDEDWASLRLRKAWHRIK